MMGVISRHVPLLFVVIAIVLPSLGPQVDHHFAERHPGHRHIGLVYQHAHQSEVAHSHSQTGSDRAGASAVVDYEGSATVPMVVVIGDKALEHFLLFEPSTLGLLLPQQKELVAQIYPTPPGKPPQSLS